MCLQRGHLRNNPHLVVKIFLTYKSAFPILPTTKSKFLSMEIVEDIYREGGANLFPSKEN